MIKITSCYNINGCGLYNEIMLSLNTRDTGIFCHDCILRDTPLSCNISQISFCTEHHGLIYVTRLTTLYK